MDERRLSTGDLLGIGILSIPPPETDVPQGREEYDSREKSVADILQALAEGKLIDVPEYYGLVSAWKDETGYHGRLLQYRAVTEAPEFGQDADACVEWIQTTTAKSKAEAVAIVTQREKRA